MSRLVRTIILAAAVCFIAGLGGAWLGLRLFAPPAPSLHALVHGEMKLSAAQHERMDAAERTYNQKKAALDQRIAAANRHLAETMSDSTGYTAAVDSSVDAVHMAMGELQKETIRYVYDMRAILTPDQAKRLDDRVFEALTRDR